MGRPRVLDIAAILGLAWRSARGADSQPQLADKPLQGVRNVYHTPFTQDRREHRSRRRRCIPGRRARHRAGRHQGRRPAAIDRPAVAGGPQAETRLRSVGRGGQRQGRDQGRRQDLQGRDRLHRLCLEHAARRAVGRADDHRGQGQLPVRAVRLRRHQGVERRLREIRHPDDRADGVVGGGVRPELQVPVRDAHAQRHGVRADRQARDREEPEHQARRHPRAQRSVPAGRRPGVREGGQGRRSSKW